MEENSTSVYKPPHRKKNRFWKPGEPLTERDKELLREVQELNEKLGYAPTKKEVSNANVLKQRFRIWEDVLKAAGIRSLKDPLEKQKRMKAKHPEGVEPVE